MTRSEAIESLKLDGITFGGNSRRLAQFFEALDMAIESLGDKWIPCSERLPERSNSYLVTLHDYDCEDVIVVADYFKPMEEWESNFGCEDITEYVIAWQPLPQPYKGE